MPPHCDAMDGPIVAEARRALEARNVDVVLPYAPETAEDEIREAFDLASTAQSQGRAAKEASELHFFETVVRLHRAGEGAPFTGLKPAGLDHGPAIPRAEEAIETGSAEKLTALLSDAIAAALEEKLAHVLALKDVATRSVADARAYASARLGFQVYANKLLRSVHADPHETHAGGDEHAD